jgi:hypothetical protein
MKKKTVFLLGGFVLGVGVSKYWRELTKQGIKVGIQAGQKFDELSQVAREELSDVAAEAQSELANESARADS